MRITTADVSEMYEQLLTGAQSREVVSSWARRLRQAEDDGDLEYIPADREKDIWAAIQFLEGVDLRDSPNSYLHIVEDIVASRTKARL